MLSASVETRRLPAILPRPRRLVSVALALVVVAVVASSTVSAQWVPGVEVLLRLALVAAVAGALLGLARPIPAPAALALLVILAPAGAFLFIGPRLLMEHPGDPRGLEYLHAWWARVMDGEAASDMGLFLYGLGVGFWLASGWLALCVTRWSQPLLGLVPLVAAFATNVLNFPAGQSGYTLAFLVFTLGLLLWQSYERSVDHAHETGTRLTGDARWDFWEKRTLLLVGMVILSILLPPLSTVDRTVDVQGGLFRDWANVQQRLNHPVPLGQGTATGTSTGFSNDVPLGGSLHRSSGVVLTYALQGVVSAPVYFRGLNIANVQRGRWSYGLGAVGLHVINPNQPIAYGEQYRETSTAAFTVTMLRPPRGYEDVLFYPGQLAETDRQAVIATISSPPASAPGPETADSVTTRGGKPGSYQVTSAFSTASEAQLRKAGTDYPDWLAPYRTYGFFDGGRGARQVRELAQQVAVGQTNPYDQVTAIERYLRSSFTYTLDPPAPPAGTDPLDYFLFSSKQGYCEYFATAMGDMLRALGIPVRLVNGYGPGTFDAKAGRYVVRESDAHTWVEAYFPSYGWIPFEPTADGTYVPIPRASGVSAVCAELGLCDTGDDPSPAPSDPAPPGKDPLKEVPEQQVGGRGALALPGWVRPAPVLGAIAVLAALLVAATMRYLRPRTVSGVWRRVLALSRVAGVEARPGETPSEFGARLSRVLPESRDDLSTLVEGFVVAAYAPPALAARSTDAVLDAWQAVRPRLLRAAASRLRPAF